MLLKSEKKPHVSSKRLTDNILQYTCTHLFKNVIDTVYGLRSISKWVTISDMLRMYVPIKQLSVFQQVKQPLDACYKHTK